MDLHMHMYMYKNKVHVRANTCFIETANEANNQTLLKLIKITF